MQEVVVYIPRSITVHLGYPSTAASNVTIAFVDYLKNVASSEIYPTWDENALRANILAQISFALNRVYTEYYRSRGYDFDITNSTAIDQAYVHGRNIFSNISNLVEELFNDYIRRIGYLEPLAAKYCNGTTVTCNGLSQWGSENLAQRGYDYMSILYSYYGNDIELVLDAPGTDVQPSYPGTALRLGSSGPDVVRMQVALNRISQSYPAIPKINPTDGLFGPKTEEAVRRFQSIFNLTSDGIIGKATWYEIVRLYVGLLRLGELNSLGQTYRRVNWSPPQALTEGDTGAKVSQLQYMLAVVAEFNNAVPPIPVTGNFGSQTRNAVIAFQRLAGLPESGIVGETTWNALYDTYAGISNTTMSRGEHFPIQEQGRAVAAARLQNGIQQRIMSRPQNGNPSGNGTASSFATTTRFRQNPGFDLRMGMRDEGQVAAG